MCRPCRMPRHAPDCGSHRGLSLDLTDEDVTWRPPVPQRWGEACSDHRTGAPFARAVRVGTRPRCRGLVFLPLQARK